MSTTLIATSSRRTRLQPNMSTPIATSSRRTPLQPNMSTPIATSSRRTPLQPNMSTPIATSSRRTPLQPNMSTPIATSSRRTPLQPNMSTPIAISSRRTPLQPSMSTSIATSSRRTRHDCYKHYRLTSYRNNLFTCDGCKMKGYGERYICDPCGSELHKECRYPQGTISHEHFGCSIFTFQKEHSTRFNPDTKHREYSKCCDACGKDIRGFSYHCETENLDLHPCCRKLEMKLVIDDKIFDLRAKPSSAKCVSCNKRRIPDGESNVPGWSYVSQCKSYRLHVCCMLEMMHEGFIRYGTMTKIELEKLDKSRRTGVHGAMFQTAKMALKLIFSAFLGDGLLISHPVVELASQGLDFLSSVT